MAFGDVMSRIFNPTSTQQQQQTVANPNPQGEQKTPAQGQKPPGQGESQQLEGAHQTQKASTPLDGYSDLWKDAPTGTPVKTAETQPNPNPNPAPQVPAYITAAKGLNFSRHIKPELMTKALQGDTASFAEIIDTVGRQASAASFQYAERHFSSGSLKLKEEITGSLPEHFREYSLRNTAIKNPVLARPEVKPVVEAIRAQMASKFPEASTEELQGKAEQYFLDMHKELGTHLDSEAATLAKSQPGREGQGAETDKQKQQREGTWDWDKEYGLTS